MNGTENLDTLESTSETRGMFRNLVLEKDGVQLHHVSGMKYYRKARKT